jgi:hypothetical protein
MTARLRTRSAPIRPASTAPREIGIDLKRSTMPLLASSLSPMPVWIAAKVIVWTKIPLSR